MYVQNLINDNSQKFALVLIEWMFTETYAGYVDKISDIVPYNTDYEIKF